MIETILNPSFFYDYLITNENYSNDFSLYALKNNFDKLHLNIFNSFGEAFDQQELTYSNNDVKFIENKITIGNFRYIGTQTDDYSIFPHYAEIFKLQILSFKDQEEDIKLLLDNFAFQLNGRFEEFTQKDNNEKSHNYKIAFSLGDDGGTAIWSDVEDLNGIECIKGTLMIIALVSEGVAYGNNIKLIASDFNDYEIKFLVSSGKTTNEIIADSDTSSQLYKNYINRSTNNISFASELLDDDFSKDIYKEWLKPTGKTYNFKLINDLFGDGKEFNEEILVLKISDVEFNFPLNQPVTYNITFVRGVE